MTDDTDLVRWLAPTTVSPLDQVDLTEIQAGWEPARVGEVPVEAAVAVIRAVGVVDPVLLRPAAGGYEIVTGHRVVAAARLAGLERVPAVVRLLDDGQALMAQALDGTASGQLTVEAAEELRRRLRSAGVDAEDVEDVMAAVPVAPAVAPPQPASGRAAFAPDQPAPPVTPPAVATPAPAPTESVLEPGLEPVPAAPPPATGEPGVEAAAEPVAEPPAVPAVEPAGAAVGEAPGPAAPVQPAAEVTAPEPPSRWVPLPSGEPRLARLSSAFADSPRMLETLAADGFTGTVELVGLDGRKDAVTFLEGQCIAVSVEEGGRRVPRNLRLPGPERGPIVEISVRAHPPTVVVALALALRSPARLVGLDARFVDFHGLLVHLSRRGRDAAVICSTPLASGVILLSGGEPIAAYARREGEATGEASETTDVEAVGELLGRGEGEVDVHDGPLVEPLDLGWLISRATTGAA